MSETEKKPTTSEKSGEKKHSSGNLFFVKAGVTLFITVVCCILFFFVLYRFSGFNYSSTTDYHRTHTGVSGEPGEEEIRESFFKVFF